MPVGTKLERQCYQSLKYMNKPLNIHMLHLIFFHFAYAAASSNYTSVDCSELAHI